MSWVDRLIEIEDRMIAGAVARAIKPYRELLEHWTHESHLQTFEDRERFRKAARALLADGRTSEKT